jgi:hypothetical protein
VIIYIDENLPKQLAEGLDILVRHPFPTFEVKSIRDTFGVGSKDQLWIPPAGRQHAAVITQDLNIHRTRSLRELYTMNGLGVFFFKPPSKKGYTYWDMVEQILKRWRSIIEICDKTSTPFAFKVTNRSTDFESMC